MDAWTAEKRASRLREVNVHMQSANLTASQRLVVRQVVLLSLVKPQLLQTGIQASSHVARPCSVAVTPGPMHQRQSCHGALPQSRRHHKNPEHHHRVYTLQRHTAHPRLFQGKGPPTGSFVVGCLPGVKGRFCKAATRHVAAHRRTGTAVTGAFLAVVKAPMGPLEGPVCLVPLHTHRRAATGNNSSSNNVQ
jgi:hypothetical protein